MRRRPAAAGRRLRVPDPPVRLRPPTAKAARNVPCVWYVTPDPVTQVDP